MRILAVIPARGGSKGIKHKNILPIAGKPLIVWSIEAALGSRYITETLVSSDSDMMLDIAEKAGANPLKRPDELATDEVGSEALIVHALKVKKESGTVYDYVILLQPTSPLRGAKEIDEAIDMLLHSDAKSLISVYTPEHTPYKAFKLDAHGKLEGLVDNKTPFMRRQDLPQTFMPNGAIYLIETQQFLSTGSLFCDAGTIAYEMSREKSIDIDTMEDVALIESMIREEK
jgi:CMP-N-acetylneuraminic acid synthetase